jgi:hypothetical protein
MNTKFTKGEWILSAQFKVAIGGNRLTTQMTGDRFASVEEREANAHLIAAAPDMYATLEMHVAAWDNLYPSDISDVDNMHLAEFQAIHEFLNKTKLLLAKARGEL